MYFALTSAASTDPFSDSGAPKSLYVVPSTRAKTLQVRFAPVQNCGVAVARLATWFPGTHADIVLTKALERRFGPMGYLKDMDFSQQEDTKAAERVHKWPPQHSQLKVTNKVQS